MSADDWDSLAGVLTGLSVHQREALRGVLLLVEEGTKTDIGTAVHLSTELLLRCLLMA